ncbi:hypothetical protein [Clostridium estertheticum]|uniref:hypothetical protein n=1 Tax=Clostridium estertheticum TaxID=238834 RepID=UPI001CF1CB39|nr:hypothetical protein [Clostridium estertheticum]MCB2357417.1 hypothetical protein [Clostridium estertheticum]WAG39325.1 hypothetical protein LL065_13515 [Clostridium estertheticum]WAG43336.1 hypothetical protein LL065_11910 [Clostridium estertheticum]
MIEKNMKLVEEVIKTVIDMKLFSKKSLSNVDAIEINDYEKAEYLAYENLDYQIENENGYSWIDLRQLEMGRLESEKYKYENHSYFDEVMIKYKSMLLKSITIRKEYEESYDDIYSDLADCLICRGLYGDNDSLFEKMYIVYKSGGWPCGWRGNYPEGKLIAFYPEE